MTIAERIVHPQPLHKFNASTDVVLQATTLSHCIALTEQLASLSTHANDIFASLVKETSDVLERISTVSDHVSRIAAKVDSANDEALAAAKFVKSQNTNSGNLNFLFKPDSLPACLQLRLDHASPMPDFSLLDEFDDSKKCSSKYSYPEFFIEQWVINERQRQKDVELQRQKKKEERRARRRNERPDKGAGEGEKSGRIAVNAVKKKQYHVLGQEFAGTDMGAAVSSTTQSSINAGTASVPVTPDAAQSAKARFSFQEEAIAVQHEAEGLQPEPVAVPESLVPAPPLLPPTLKAPPPPPPPPAPPLPSSGSPLAPLAVPPPPPPPMAQTSDSRAPATPAAGDDRSALLASIQQGMKLKPALRENVSAKPVTERDNLLVQIRQGSKLRSTPKATDGTPKKTDDAYSEIKALLDRRQFLVPVDSDHSGGDDDYDSDDWKD